MTPEEQQSDMSMEDILSSIKDILENNSEEDEDTATEQALAPKEEKQIEDMPQTEENLQVSDQEAEDDVFDLSKAMIVDENEPESQMELDETGPDFEITPHEDPLFSPDDIKLPDFENEDANMDTGLINLESDVASKILDDSTTEKSKSEASSDVDFDFNIDDILQSASDAITEQGINQTEEKQEPQPEMPGETESKISEFSEIDVTSEPILDEESEHLSQPRIDTAPSFTLHQEEKTEIVPQEENNILEIDSVSEQEVSTITETEEKTEKILPMAEIPAAVDEDSQEIADADFSEIEETMVSEPLPVEETKIDEEQETQPENKKEDAADVSADIINNFAKMFAEQTQEHQEKPKEEKSEVPANVSGMGDGNKTIEQVVENVIQGIIASSVSAEMAKNVDIVAFAKKEIHAQTRAWLEANLPAIVNAAVKEEMERVMAKVGK